MSGWGNLFGKIADQFQGRIERLRNERIRLQQELKDLQDKPCTPQSSARVSKIEARLTEIDNILVSNAKD